MTRKIKRKSDVSVCGGDGSSKKRQHDNMKTSETFEAGSKLRRSPRANRNTDAIPTLPETPPVTPPVTPPLTPPPSDNVVPDASLSCSIGYYPKSNAIQGVALIFSHERFDDRSCVAKVPEQPTRSGTQADRDELRETFESLGFKVRCFDDLQFFQIMNELKIVALQGNYDCVVVAVLTHGDRNGKLRASDKDYCVSELWKPFRASQCPSLAGKPKLFFVQASNGGDFEADVTISNKAQDVPDQMTEETVTYPVPSYADILVSYYYTLAGMNPYSDAQDGSLYVKTLCSLLKSHGKSMELILLLIEVTQLMYQKVFPRNYVEPRLEDVVHAPCFTSTLRMRLCFDYPHQQCHQDKTKRKRHYGGM